MIRYLLCFGLFSLSAFALATAPARACSPPPSWLVNERAVAPGNGASNVPINAKVSIAYEANAGMRPPPLDHPKLQLSTGEPVAVDIAMHGANHFILTPQVPLAPNTQYEILSDFARVPCVLSAAGASYPLCTQPRDAGGTQDGGEVDGGVLDAGGTPAATAPSSTMIASFTTGQTPDETPPAPPGPITTISEPDSCTGSACCFSYSGFRIRLNWGASADDLGVAYYEVSSPEGVVIPMQLGTSAHGTFYCTSDYPSATLDKGLEHFLGTPGKYQVVAVDWAGHRSAPVSKDIENPCGGGASCRMGAAPTTPATYAVIAAGLGCLLLLRLRNRRRTNRP